MRMLIIELALHTIASIDSQGTVPERRMQKVRIPDVHALRDRDEDDATLSLSFQIFIASQIHETITHFYRTIKKIDGSTRKHEFHAVNNFEIDNRRKRARERLLKMPSHSRGRKPANVREKSRRKKTDPVNRQLIDFKIFESTLFVEKNYDNLQFQLDPINILFSLGTASSCVYPSILDPTTSMLDDIQPNTSFPGQGTARGKNELRSRLSM